MNRSPNVGTGAHTAGPWTLETVRTSCGVCHKIGPFPWKHDKQNHACIYVDYPNHDGRGQFEDELMANARLIAESPAMLEALVRFCDVYESDSPLRPAALVNECRKARAVIARATVGAQ